MLVYVSALRNIGAYVRVYVHPTRYACARMHACCIRVVSHEKQHWMR